jgi:hypothetical protein
MRQRDLCLGTTLAGLVTGLLAGPTPRARADSSDAGLDSPVAAGVPTGSVHLGASLGAHVNLGSWDLYRVPDQGVDIGPGAALALRGGSQLTSWLGVEADLAFLTIAGTLPPGLEVSGTALHAGAGVLLTPIDAAWAPFASAGLGVFYSLSGTIGADIDWDFHTGAGVRRSLGDTLVLRGEARVHWSDPLGAGLAPVLTLLVGADFIVAGSAAETRDQDDDGVLDRLDVCPDLPGVRAVALLKDGVGLGCPDMDRDGLIDRDDRCVMEPGPQRLKGCADRDGDGIADIDDTCRDKPGLPEFEGCPPPLPDGDRDGVSDDVDGCPEERGSVATEGCPDSDGDGIADLFDRCSDEVGVSSESGCMPKALAKRFVGAVRGLTFSPGTVAPTAAALRLLDELARTFAPHDTLVVALTVTAGPAGGPDDATALAELRAAALLQALVDRGIPAARIAAEGEAGPAEQVVVSYRGRPAAASAPGPSSP